jgi:magnesium-protoporphyrin O-methyltransferase
MPDDCCPQPERDPRIGSYFDSLTRQRTAGGVLPPMQPVSHGLYEELRDAASVRPSVLELGCGSGALGVALLELGASRYEGVDLSPESLAAAYRRADGAGVTDRASFLLGDGARLLLEPHDWVVMDRVICCYPDMDALLDNALTAAGNRVAFTVPHSRGWRGMVNRVIWGVEGLLDRIRSASPGYVHSLARIEARLAAAGFRRLRDRPGLLWYTAVWEKA